MRARVGAALGAIPMLLQGYMANQLLVVPDRVLRPTALLSTACGTAQVVLQCSVQSTLVMLVSKIVDTVPNEHVCDASGELIDMTTTASIVFVSLRTCSARLGSARLTPPYTDLRDTQTLVQ